MKAMLLAQKLLVKARQNELMITTDIRKIAAFTKAKVVGLENRLKTEQSLARKIADISTKFKIQPEKIASRNNDVLRYTFIFSDEKYQSGFNLTLDTLKIAGYNVAKIFNAWENENTPKDTGYRGINITVISSQKQKFELQFHTDESFRVKSETHNLYDEQRNPQTSEKRRREIIEIVKRLSKKIRRPNGI